MADNTLIDQFIRICGDKYVLTSTEDKAPHLTDWRGHYTGDALAVVKPKSTEEVAALVRLCLDHRIPIVPQGGNTSLCVGQHPMTAARRLSLA